MTSEQLVRRVFFGLTLVFIVFIVYASWTPGAGGLGGERQHFQAIDQPAEAFRVHDLRDIATNVLLYIPLGLLLALAVSRGKPRFVSPWLICGLVVSLVMEVGQMFIGRTPDVVDLTTNSIGYVVGYCVVVAGIRFYGLDSSVVLGIGRADEQDARTQSIAAFRFIYICIYALIALLPFDVSVSLEKIYAQLLPDDAGKVRIVLDPGYRLVYWEDNGIKVTLELLGLVPVAVLTAFLSGIRGRLSMFTAIFSCVALAGLCEVAQLFILSRTSDIAMIPIATLSGILGWALIKVWFNLQPVEVIDDGVTRGARWRPLAVALIGYAVIVAFFAWSPFRFETDPTTVIRKILYDSNLVPFKEHFAVRSLGSAVDIVKEVGLFVPFGVLLGFLLVEIRPGMSRLKVILFSGLVAMVFATLTELSQSVCIGRYIDVTDVFLAGVGGVCGSVLLRLFHAPGGGRRSEAS